MMLRSSYGVQVSHLMGKSPLDLARIPPHRPEVVTAKIIRQRCYRRLADEEWIPTFRGGEEMQREKWRGWEDDDGYVRNPKVL